MSAVPTSARRTAPARIRRARRWVPGVAGAIAVLTIAAGLGLTLGGVQLGTALPPFWMHWSPSIDPDLIVAVAVAAGLVVALPWASARIRSPVAFAGVSYGGSLALGLAVNAARIGPAAWDQVFRSGPGGSYEWRFEYLPALSLLHGGLGHYLREYPQELPYLPTHAKGNPPGPIVVMHLLGIDTPARLAAACILVGALCAPLAYALGRELGGEARGRRAALLTAFSPGVVLFGVTSADYAFAALGAAAAWLLVCRGPRRRAAGAALAAVGSFSSWLLLAIPVWAVLVVLRRDGRRPALAVAVSAAGAIVALNLALFLVTGYDPIATVRALGPIYAHGEAAQRPYAFWVFGSPVAFGVMLGLPVAIGALRALVRGEAAALALALVIVVSALAGFTKAETERIWLPFVPLACVAAASVGPRRPRRALAGPAAQAIVIEVLFATVW